MTRKLRMFGVALFGVMALAALASSAASAATGITKPAEAITLTTTPDEAVVGTHSTTGHQVIDTAGASITCPTLTGDATITGAGTSFTTALFGELTYAGTCKFIGQTATINTNGCKYNIESLATGTTQLFIKGCNAGKTIEFSVPSPACKTEIPEQGPLGDITLHNPNVNEVTVEIHVTGFKYTATGAGCPETGTKTNGNYTTGNFRITAEKAGTNTMVAIQAINPDKTP